MSEKLGAVFSVIAVTLFLAFGVFQLVVGWIGIEEAFGGAWAVAAVTAAVFFRFTIPVVFGVYLCATEVWGWHWAAAALLSFPGLLFMLPAIGAGLISAFKK